MRGGNEVWLSITRPAASPLWSSLWPSPGRIPSRWIRPASAAQTYAQTSPLAYVGQVLSVVVDGTATIYQIKNAAGDLEALGTGDLEGDVASIISAKTASTENVNEMIGEVYGAENEAEG